MNDRTDRRGTTGPQREELLLLVGRECDGAWPVPVGLTYSTETIICNEERVSIGD